MIDIISADLHHPEQGAAIVKLLNDYACDFMGGAEPLSAFCQTNLIRELQKRSNVHVFLAYADGVPAGLCICIEGFSTFACKPLLNIHDLAVSPTFRGLGISKHLLAAAQQRAQQLGCCKITLEVLQGNHKAHDIYASVGFAQYQLDPSTGGAIMMQKYLLTE